MSMVLCKLRRYEECGRMEKNDAARKLQARTSEIKYLLFALRTQRGASR